jgi:general secretion pathway protein M
MNTANLRLWWGQRSHKEKWALKLAVAVLAGYLVWALALAPALRTLRGYEVSRFKLDADLQTMQGLQAQAQALQSMPRLSQLTATQALRDSVQNAFGKNADFSANGANATVTLRSVPADTLAQWLLSARTQALSAPIQARLSNTTSGWSGTLQMALPNS